MEQAFHWLGLIYIKLRFLSIFKFINEHGEFCLLLVVSLTVLASRLESEIQ